MNEQKLTVQQISQMLLVMHEELMEQYENKQISFYSFHRKLLQLQSEMKYLKLMVSQYQDYQSKIVGAKPSDEERGRKNGNI